MKKKLLLFLMILASIALLTSCACEHEWVDATCLVPKTCSLCEEIEGEALGHTWVDPNCVDPKTCSACGLTEGEALGHTWVDADCVTPKTCSVCAATEGEALGHTWVDADCVTPKTCSVCNATEGEALGHTWVDATCEVPKTCSVCNATEGEALGHTWVDATCELPKTCSVCAATEGEALGHTWVDATCELPKTCSACAATEGEALGHAWAEATCELPKTCSVCAATEGEALGHTWAEATCEVPKTCSVCAATEGEALGHTWMDATYEAPKTCSVCGATEGEPLVRIPLDGEPAKAGPTIGKLDYSIPAEWVAYKSYHYYTSPDDHFRIAVYSADPNGKSLQEFHSTKFPDAVIDTNKNGVEYIFINSDNNVPGIVVTNGSFFFSIELARATEDAHALEEGDPMLLLADDIIANLCTSEGGIPASVVGSSSGLPLQYFPLHGELYYAVPEGIYSDILYSPPTYDRYMNVIQRPDDRTTADLFSNVQNNGIEFNTLEMRTNKNGVEYIFSEIDKGESGIQLEEALIYDNVFYSFTMAYDYTVFGTNDGLYTFAQDVTDSLIIIE